MLAGDLAVGSLSVGLDRVAIRSACLLLDLAISVDLIFAAELFSLSSAPAQDHAPAICARTQPFECRPMAG
jgi:hypothetical protein